MNRQKNTTATQTPAGSLVSGRSWGFGSELEVRVSSVEGNLLSVMGSMTWEESSTAGDVKGGRETVWKFLNLIHNEGNGENERSLLEISVTLISNYSMTSIGIQSHMRYSKRI